MAINPKITSALKTFSGKPLGVMSKALGVASVASVVYDAHVNAVERAKYTDNIESADRFSKQYNQYMSSTRESATVCKLKKHWFDFQQNFSLYHPISKTKGYVGGFLNTVINEAPVVALSVVSLASKSWVGKAAGVALALNGIKTLFVDVFGIGSQHKNI